MMKVNSEFKYCCEMDASQLGCIEEGCQETAVDDYSCATCRTCRPTAVKLFCLLFWQTFNHVLQGTVWTYPGADSLPGDRAATTRNAEVPENPQMFACVSILGHNRLAH